MAAGQDDLSIRVGLNWDVVEDGAEQVDEIEEKVRSLRPQIRQSQQTVDNTQRQLESIQRQVLQTGLRYVGASTLSEGLSSLLPTQTHSGVKEMARIGSDVGLQSIFLGASGGITTLMMSAISIAQRKITELFALVEEDRERIKQAKNGFQAALEKIANDLGIFRGEEAGRIRDLEAKLFLDLLNEL